MGRCCIIRLCGEITDPGHRDVSGGRMAGAVGGEIPRRQRRWSLEVRLAAVGPSMQRGQRPDLAMAGRRRLLLLNG
jgi:hypothetical protein